jgi:hypothetical protein
LSSQSKSLSLGVIFGIVIGVIAGLVLLSALLWFFWRRISHNNNDNVPDSGDLGADEYMKPITHPWQAHEMETEAVPEPGHRVPIIELPTTSVHYEPIKGPVLVDEGVAAGYDGAYRGN